MKTFLNNQNVQDQRIKADLQVIKGVRSKKSYREIAGDIGVKPSVVSGRIFRMRQEKSPYHDLLPPAGHLSEYDISKRNVRNKSTKVSEDYAEIKNLSFHAPNSENLPKPFMDLSPYQCSWCLDDVNEPGHTMMMCCGADVMDKSRREGDGRASYCAFHYNLSIAHTDTRQKKPGNRKGRQIKGGQGPK